MPGPARNLLLAVVAAVALLAGSEVYASLSAGMLDPASAQAVTGGAFPPGVDVGLDAAQLAQAARALTVADQVNAPPLPVLAMVDAGLGESEFRDVPNGQGSGYCGVFQGNPRNVACSDTELQARSFLRGGHGFRGGGAIALAQGTPGMDPGEIATLVEASGKPGSFYGVHTPQATRIIAAWRAGASPFPSDAGLPALVAEADRMTALHQPYVWGGGHVGFSPTGPWDCSGAISQLMHHLGLLDGGPITSTGFMTQGQPGRGQLFTVYANPIHVFLIVEAGSHRGQAWGTTNFPLSLDVASPVGGPAWSYHATGGFVARHYPGW